MKAYKRTKSELSSLYYNIRNAARARAVLAPAVKSTILPREAVIGGPTLDCDVFANPLGLEALPEAAPAAPASGLGVGLTVGMHF